MLGFVIQVSIYTHFKSWPGTTAKNAAQGPLVGIEPTALANKNMANKKIH